MTPRSQWNKPKRALQSCATCNAFVPNPGHNSRAGEARHGTCRATPPVMFMTMTPKPGSALGPAGPQMVQSPAGTWTPTTSELWCRAWEPQEEEDDRTDA